MRESAAASHIRLDAAGQGIDLWRNNVGVLKDDTGRPIRFGLANDSKNLNMEVKSSDLIGIVPVFITPDMVGQILGVFAAVETKESDWVFSSVDKRALAQKKFHDIVKKNGGFAGFARNVAEFRKIIGR